MKNLFAALLVSLFLAISPNLFSQNVSINADGSLADTSAMLDVSSTTKGVLLPRMTTTQQNSIILPANGLTIFNTTLNAVMLNIGTPLSPNWSSIGIASAGWSITGNSGINPASNFLGTTDNKSLRFRTNSTQGMILDSLGNVSVGASTTILDATNPEKFLVNAGTTSSVNAIVGKGNINSYLQLNIQNQSAGTNASSDVVATANNGNETSNYVDMGVNGGSNTSHVMGVANDAYFYNLGQNLFIGTGTAAKSLIFVTGGTDSATNERMRIDGNGNVGIGTASPATALHVVKSNPGSNVLTLENSSASGYSSADFLNSSAGLSGTFGYANAGAGGLFGGRDYFNSYTNDFLWTANSSSAAIFVKGSNSNVGIGTTTPATALHVYGTNPLTLTGVQLGTTTTADSLLTINSGTVQKLPLSTFITPANAWSTTGNTGTSYLTNFLGTTDNKSLRFRTNNTQQMKIDSTGRVAIGQDNFDATNPEKVVINAGATGSVNGLVVKGSIDNYFQFNIKNQSATTNATTDIVATADNGTEATNYVDLGINGSNYSGSAIETGVANDGYLISAANDFYLVNSSANKNLLFLTGGTGVANERLRILANGYVGLGVQDPGAQFVVKDTIQIRRTGAVSQLLFTNTAGTGDFRIGGDGGDLFWQGGGGRDLQMGSYWATILTGDRQTSTYPGFISNTSGTGVIVLGQRDASVPLGVQANSATQSANLTEWRNSSGTVLSAVDKNGNFGIGNSSPSEKVDVTGNIKFSGALMPNNSAGTSGYVLTSNGAGSAPTWSSVSSSNAWALGGNSVASVQNIGTISNYDFPFITNNTEKMRLTSAGSLGIGTTTFNGTYPERLLVDAGSTGNTNYQNVIVGKGNTNNYAQLNIQNSKAGTNASSDVVATSNNGSESINYIDMGINSGSNTSSGVYGGANTAYLYSTGNDFAFGNATSGKNLIFFTGGTASANEAMRIDGSGNVGIATTTPNSTLQNTGSFSQNIVIKTNDYTASAADYTIVCNSNSVTKTITLPTAVGITGRIYVIKRGNGSQNVTVATYSTQTIDGAAFKSLGSTYTQITVQSDGSNWIVLSN